MSTTRISFAGQIGVLSQPSNPKGFAIHLAGLPNNPEPIPGITQFLVEQGLSVLQPHYNGSHDSDGIFDPSLSHQCVEFWLNALDCNKAIDVRSQQKIQISRHDLRILSCHSFGTFVGMNALCSGLVARKAVFFAPMFSFGSKASDYGLRLNLKAHGKYIAAAYPLTFRTSSASVLPDFYGTSHESKVVDSPCKTSCFFVAGEEDPGVDSGKCLAGATDFIHQRSERFVLNDAVVAIGANHSVSSMLTDAVKSSLVSWIDE
jgi:alpha/beta superfamily hydrolase